MAEVQSNIRVNIDTTSAVASLKLLQNQISAFHTQMSKAGAAPAAIASSMQQNLINSINASGKFAASMTSVKSETEAFTTALEKNKLSMGEYFRYAGASTKSFGRLFSSEFSTINKVAESRVKSLQTQYIKMGRDASGALQAIKVRPLTLDMNDLATRTAVAAQKQQILNQLLKQGSTNLLNWGKNTQWAGRQLMVGFSIPLMMAATAASKAYSEMETASIKLRRVYGDLKTTEEQTRQIAKDVQSIGHEFTKYGIAVADTMDLAATIAATGKQGQELLTQVRETTRMAALGGIDQNAAMETTISLTNAFGIAAKDLGSNIDFLNFTQNQTILSLSDMTEAIPKAAPVVQQLGGDVKDLAFFLTAMKEGGINAAQGANAIKSGFASIINPTKQATEFLSGFNINLNGIVSSNKGNIKQTVIDLGNALNKLDPLNRAQAIEKLFGKFQFSRMSALLKNVTDANSQAATVSKIAAKSQTELSILAERELRRVSDSPMYKFKQATAELKTALVPLGEQFMTAVTPIANFLTKVLKGFNELNDQSGGFFSNMAMWVAGIGPVVLMVVGLIANGVANMVKLFANVKSFINKTQTASVTLGETTHYLTQEQINAAAAASSLEQSHMNLAQAFSVEKSNLALLIAEYQRAIAVQAEFTGMNVIPRGPVNKPAGKKFADGGRVVKGPGGPRDDAIPAELSNGEVVLSVDTVKKNPALVSALLGGGKVKVPGFSGGGSTIPLPGAYAADVGNVARRRASISANVINLETAGFGAEVERVVAQLHEFGATTTQARQLLGHMNIAAQKGDEELQKWVGTLDTQIAKATSGGQLVQEMKSATGIGKSGVSTNFTHIGGGASYFDESAGRNVTVKSQLGMAGFDAGVNRDLAKGGASVDRFIEAFDTAGVEKWSESIRRGGGNVEQLSGEIKLFDNKLKEVISKSGATTVFDTEEQARRFGPGGISVQGAYAEVNREMAGTPTMDALGAAASTGREERRKGAGTSLGGDTDRALMKTQLEAAYKQELEVAGQNIGKQSSDSVKKGVLKGVETSARIASPSKVAEELTGKNIVDGVMLPLREAKPQADAAGRALSSSFIKPMTEAVKQPVVKKQIPTFFGPQSGMSINTSNAQTYIKPEPTRMQAAIAGARSNLAREGVWLKEEWAAIINPMKATISAAKGQIVSDAILIEGNVKKAFRTIVPETSAVGQAFSQLKAVMTVARGNFMTEWGYIKEDFLGGTRAMKTGAVDIESAMAKAGRMFGTASRAAQFALAKGDMSAILTKKSLAALTSGIGQPVIAAQKNAWQSLISTMTNAAQSVKNFGISTWESTTKFGVSAANAAKVAAHTALDFTINAVNSAKAAAQTAATFVSAQFNKLIDAGRPAANAALQQAAAQQQLAAATKELEFAQKRGIATAEQAMAVKNAEIELDRAKVSVGQTKTQLKGMGGLSMGLMMAPMLLSQDKGPMGSFVNKNMGNIMVASMMLPMIAPIINATRAMVAKMLLAFAPLTKNLGWGKLSEAGNQLVAAKAAEKAASLKNAAASTAEAGANAAAAGSEGAETGANAAAVAAENLETGANVGAVVSEGAEIAANTGATASETVETVSNVAAAASTFTVAGAMALLASPVVIVTAGLLALAAVIAIGVIAYNAHQEELKKQRKEGFNLAKATAMTTDKLIALSKVTKTVSATEEAAAKRRASYANAAGTKNQSIGEQLIGSDFGKSVINDVKTMKKGGMSTSEISGSISNSLGTAVMEGVLSADEAKSFAAALGEKFKDLQLTTSITGKIDELLGPGGENVVGPNAKPFEVGVKISDQAQKNFQDAFKGAVTYDVTTDGVTTTTIDTKKVANATQLGIQSIQTNQQMVDSIMKKSESYQKSGVLTADEQASVDKIQGTNKDTTNKLQDIAKTDTTTFESVIASNIAALKKASPELAGVYDASLKTITESDATKNDSALKADLQIGLASGSLDPKAIEWITDPKNKSAVNNFKIAFSQSPGNANAIIQQLTAKGATTKTINAALKLPTTKQTKMLDYLAWADKHGVKVNTAAVIKDPDGAFKKVEKYNKMPKKITKEQAVKLGYIEKNSDKYKNWDKVHGNKAISSTVAINYIENNKDAFDRWYLAEKAATTSSATSTSTGTSTDGSGSKDPTLLQDQQAIIAQNKATRAIIASGFGSDFAQMLGSADAKARAMYMTIKNGKAVLTAAGQKLKEAFSAQTVGAFIAKQAMAVKQFQEETKVRNLLNGKIKDKTLLSKMMADADFKAAMASALNIKNSKDRAKAINELIAIEKKYLSAADASATAALTPGEKAQKENDVRSAYIQQYQDAISSLKPQEDAINKAYDERVAALEKVSQLNKEIADSQKAQLDMADALSKGDISAAAKTAADIRTRAAADSLESQKRALSDAKDAALKALTVTVNGELLTIETLTNRIAALEATNAAVSRDIIDPEAINKAVADNGGVNPVATMFVPPTTTTTTTTTSGFSSEFLRTALIQLQSNGTAGLTADQAKGLNIKLPTTTVVAPKVETKIPIGNGVYVSSVTGKVVGLSTGGMVPKYFANGGFARGTDTIPAMLTPGEFVIKKYAVDDFGVNNLKSINNGTYSENSDANSVYNYNLSINVKSDSDPNQIAQTVMAQIKQIDSQRLRGNRI